MLNVLNIIFSKHIFFLQITNICAITNMNLCKYVHYKYLFKNVQCILIYSKTPMLILLGQTRG